MEEIFEESKVRYINNKLDMQLQEGETASQKLIRENGWVLGDVINQSIDLLSVFPNQNTMSFTNASAVNFKEQPHKLNLKNTNLFYIHATTDEGFNPNDLDNLFEHVDVDDQSKKSTFVITAKVGPHFETYMCNTDGEILILKTDDSKQSEIAKQEIAKVMQVHDIKPKEPKTIVKMQKTGSDSGPVVITNALTIDPNDSLYSAEQEKNLTYAMLAIINEKQAHLREMLYHLMRNGQMMRCWELYASPETQHLLYSAEETHRENYEGVQAQTKDYADAFFKFIADYTPPESEQLVGKIESRMSDDDFHRTIENFCKMQSYEYKKNGEASANVETNITSIRAEKAGDSIRFTAERIESGREVDAIKEFAQLIQKVSGQNALVDFEDSGTAFERFQAYVTCVKRGLYVECKTDDFSDVQKRTISQLKSLNDTNKLKFEGKYKEEKDKEDNEEKDKENKDEVDKAEEPDRMIPVGM